MKARVAILGNLNESYEPHYKMIKSFRDFQEKFDFSFEWIPTEDLLTDAAQTLDGFSGIVAGSGPYKSKEGVINGIRFARKNNIPFLGTCSGFGYAVLEFAQDVFNLPLVYHPHENSELPPGEIFLQTLNLCGVGLHTISFVPVKGTLTARIYNNKPFVEEESHCMYGVNQKMIEAFTKEGLIVSGMDEEMEPKIMEYKPNDFFVITLFLPQLKSDRENPHPLLSAFFEAVKIKNPVSA
jgi:CTP synthase (UTP-ammonia lyase)